MPLALLLVLQTCNNTDGNKLVIFSGMALYYGDTYIYNLGYPKYSQALFCSESAQVLLIIIDIDHKT